MGLRFQAIPSLDVEILSPTPLQEGPYWCSDSSKSAPSGRELWEKVGKTSAKRRLEDGRFKGRKGLATYDVRQARVRPCNASLRIRWAVTEAVLEWPRRAPPTKDEYHMVYGFSFLAIFLPFPCFSSFLSFFCSFSSPSHSTVFTVPGSRTFCR